MSMEKKSLVVGVYKLTKSLEGSISDVLAKLAEHKLGDVSQVRDEQKMGFVSGKTFSSEIDESNGICGGYIYLSLRRAYRKIPASMMNTYMKQRETAWKLANKSAYVPTKVRKELKDDIVDQHIMSMPIQFSDTFFTLDVKHGLLYINSASTNRVEDVALWIFRALDTEAVQEHNLHDSDCNSTGYEELQIGTEEKESENPSIERDFLTYLWYDSDTRILHEGYSFDFSGDLVLSDNSEDDIQGAVNTILRRGYPTRSVEAQSALKVGKKLKQAKFTLCIDRLVWDCKFDADKFAFRLTLPEGEQMEPESRFAENVEFVKMFYDKLMQEYDVFVKKISSSQQVEELQTQMKAWVNEMDVR